MAYNTKRKKEKTAMALLEFLSGSELAVCPKPTKMAKSNSSICEYMIEAPKNTPVAIGVLSCRSGERYEGKRFIRGGEASHKHHVTGRDGSHFDTLTLFMVMVPPTIMSNKIPIDQIAAKPAAWLVLAVSTSF